MPTLSQCQILKSVLDKKKAPPSAGQIKLAAKLETLEINEEEEDLFGLQELKTKLHEAQERATETNKLLPTTSGDPKPFDPIVEPKTPQNILPELPKPLRNHLYGLGFRKSPAVKRRNPEVKIITTDADDIINRMLSGTIMPKKKKPPTLKPRAICFNYPGSGLTHLEVKRAMDKVLEPFPEIKMKTIEFQPRIKLTRPDKTENTCRWVITVNSDWAENRLLGVEITVGSVTTTMKRYDDVVNLEFRQFGRMCELMKMVKGNR